MFNATEESANSFDRKKITEGLTSHWRKITFENHFRIWHPEFKTEFKTEFKNGFQITNIQPLTGLFVKLGCSI